MFTDKPPQTNSFSQDYQTIDTASVNRDRTRIIEVSIEDEWKNDKFEEISAEVERLMELGFHGDTSIDLTRKRKSAIDKTNPSTIALLERLPSFESWLDTVPTAAALDPIYQPNSPILPNGEPLDDEIHDWFKNIYDGIGIRSRARVMKDVIINEVLEHDNSQPARWISLACGAAQPVFESLVEVEDAGGRLPHVTLVDADKKALGLAKSYADEKGYGDSISLTRTNILRRNGITHDRSQGGLFTNAIASKLGRLQPEAYDMVDAVGILEYLKEEDWKYSYDGVIKTKQTMAGATTFIKNAFELVRPGGVLVVGNMRDTHPQLGFTLNTIQWPHIQPRSIDDMRRIIEDSGIDTDIDVYCPTDNVYAIYSLRKPA